MKPRLNFGNYYKDYGYYKFGFGIYFLACHGISVGIDFLCWYVEFELWKGKYDKP